MPLFARLMAHIPNGVIFTREELNSFIWSKMHGTGTHNVNYRKPDTESQMPYALPHVSDLKRHFLCEQTMVITITWKGLGDTEFDQLVQNQGYTEGAIS